MTATSALLQLSGAYLNEDWTVDYATWQEAVDAFVVESPDEAPMLPDEIAQVLDAYPTEQRLGAHMLEQGFDYLPRSGDGGYRGLLTKIADRVSKASANG